MDVAKALQYGLNAGHFASIQLQSYNSTIGKIAYLRPWTYLFAIGSNIINICCFLASIRKPRSDEDDSWEKLEKSTKVFYTILGIPLAIAAGFILFIPPYIPTHIFATQLNSYLLPPKFALPTHNGVELSLSPSFGYKDDMLASSLLNSLLSIATIIWSKDRLEKQDSTMILFANALSSYKITRWKAVTASIIQKIPAYNFGLFGWYATEKVDQIKYNYTFQVLTDNQANLFSLKADGSRLSIGAILQDFKDKIASFTDLPQSLSLKTAGTPKLFEFRVPAKHKPEPLSNGFFTFTTQALLNGKQWIQCFANK